MTGEHRRCRQAIRNDVYGRWECCRCGEVIGHGSPTMIAFVPGLQRIAKAHGGVKTYGPTEAVRLRGETPPSGPGQVPIRGREFYVYCLRAGCRVGQHLTLASP